MHRQPNSSSEQSSSETPLALEELARLRQGAYRLFSQSWLYPDTLRLETNATIAEELNQQGERWSAFAFFPEWSRFLSSLESLRYQEPVAIQGEYISNFLVNRAGTPCPIYESAYLEDDPSAAGWLLAQLEEAYAKMGLSLAPALREPPDHVAVELEFMSFLCGREAEAWEGRDLSRALESLASQHAFLSRHLAWWLGEFAYRLATTDCHSVFAAGTQATRAFLTHDTDLIDSLLNRFEGLRAA